MLFLNFSQDREMNGSSSRAKFLFALLVLWSVALVISGINPKDRLTWFLEVCPVLMVGPMLWFTRTSFPLSRVIYLFIFIHGLVLMIGGHYTYAEVPAGFWTANLLGWSRNPFDRLGHLLQGFVPALVIREMLMRWRVVKDGRWTFFITVCICLSVSAFYEFIEWWSALLLGQEAEAFLGTQGDPWDTQWDMFMATVGALAAQLLIPSVAEGPAKDRR